MTAVILRIQSSKIELIVSTQLIAQELTLETEPTQGNFCKEAQEMK